MKMRGKAPRIFYAGFQNSPKGGWGKPPRSELPGPPYGLYPLKDRPLPEEIFSPKLLYFSPIPCNLGW